MVRLLVERIPLVTTGECLVMETNDHMMPSYGDLDDTYRCLDCEALLSGMDSIMRRTCPDCYGEWQTNMKRKTIKDWREQQ